MKYDITHKCGHESSQQLYGKNTERERKIAYLETTLCEDCYMVELAAEVNGEWIEMHYGEYKENHADKTARKYNSDTKTIMVLIPGEPVEEEAAEEEPEARKEYMADAKTVSDQIDAMTDENKATYAAWIAGVKKEMETVAAMPFGWWKDKVGMKKPELYRLAMKDSRK